MPHETSSSPGVRYGWKAVALRATLGGLALAGAAQAADWQAPPEEGSIQCELINDGPGAAPETTFTLNYSVSDFYGGVIRYGCYSQEDQKSAWCVEIEEQRLTGLGSGEVKVDREVYGDSRQVSDSDKPLICAEGFKALEIKQKW